MHKNQGYPVIKKESAESKNFNANATKITQFFESPASPKLKSTVDAINGSDHQISVDPKLSSENTKPESEWNNIALSNDYKCDECGKSFKRMCQLRPHKLYSHDVNNAENSESVPTKVITKRKYTKLYGQEYKQQKALELSSDSESTDSKSANTNNAGDSESAALDVDSVSSNISALYDTLTKLKQTPIGESVYKCRLCKKITLELREHLKHIITHTGQKWNTCLICADIFLGDASLDEHMLKEHNNKNSSNNNNEPNTNNNGKNNNDNSNEDHNNVEYLKCGILKCQECTKSFLSLLDFERHKRLHAGEQLFECEICQTVFTSDNVLRKHKTKHKESEKLPKRFKCVFCNEAFAFQIFLTYHKYTHPEFFELIERTTILIRYKNNNKILYACRMCGRSTHMQNRHFEHIRTHGNRNDRPTYKCQICSKHYTAKSTLRTHERLHRDVRPHKCEICAMCFTERKTLRLHLLKHSGERPANCPYCGCGFLTRNLCAEHVRRVHTGETPYQCDICGEWFTVAAQVPLHKRQKHNVDTRMKRTVERVC